jgi:transposase
MMVTIAWNTLGFHSVDALSKDSILNAESYRDNILTALILLLPAPDERQLAIQADNARPQTAQKCRTFCAENGMRVATHPPDSPDLAPSDFFLFEHVKNGLQGITFQSHDELLTGIVAVLGLIPIESLQCVFERWMERLEWVSQNNGDSSASDKHPQIQFSASAIGQ